VRFVVSDVWQGPGSWLASDGKWYALHEHPSYRAFAGLAQALGWERHLPEVLDALDEYLHGRRTFDDDRFGTTTDRERLAWVLTWHIRARLDLLAIATGLSAGAIARAAGVPEPPVNLFYPSEVDTRRVLENLMSIESLIAEGGLQAVKVADWQMAEEVAALWMRENGWPDAHVVSSHQDRGIDVSAETAVAQVKWFTSGRVGRPALQQLRGATPTGVASLFFACADAGGGRPFTPAALEWAAANGMRLFAVNAFARISEIELADEGSTG
jgi:hypothetical protein